MNEKEFNKLLIFFENNDIHLVSREYCHKCEDYKEEDVDVEGWLYERLVDEQALEDL